MGKIKKKIASIACAFTMMLSSVTTCFSAFGAETETDTAAETTTFASETVTEASETTQTEQTEVLTEPEEVLPEPEEVLTEQSISLYPNGEEAEQVITLNGMMPEGAAAEAVDVSEFHEGVSAYDITITSGEQEYQPGEEHPIRVEICDPVISDSAYIELWHIADDGTRERITDFSVTDSTISFEATAFSVYEIVTADDPTDLDGKTFALIMTKLDKPAALMADDYPGNSNRRKAVEATIRNNPFVNGTNIYQTPDTDLTLWTFENIGGSKYYVMTKIDGSYKYLRISGRNNPATLTLTDTPDDDCELTVVQGTGNYSGMIQIKNSAGMAVNLKSKQIANGFQGYTAGNGANEWLSLAQLSVIKDDDFVTNIAKKISVSEIQEGQQVVVYTRVWDNADKAYKYYIVDYEGNLIPAYEIGENLEWHGLKIGTVFWEFTEYKNADGSPNYYYELQNTYSGNYLAPQIVDGQIISPDPIGINLNGRKNDKYYSTILAWDKTYYQYAGLKVDGDHIVSAPKSKADDFYFAVIKPPVSELTTVDTINNNDYGITMRMIDYGNGKLINNKTRSQDQYDVITEDSFTAGPNPVPGILEPWLDPNTGYPRVTEKGNSSSTAENPISLSSLFSGAYEVNNLFLKNTYNESGYFEYDCTNNFAYLDPVTHTFRVYDQVATVEAGNGETRQHGQFLPYNDLDPSRLSEIKNQTDALGISLPYDDPRRSKPLYSIPYQQNSLNGENGNADYCPQLFR